MTIFDIDLDLPGWAQRLSGVAAFVLALALLHRVMLVVLRRLAARTATRTDDILIARLGRPTFWLVIGIALAASGPGLDLPRYWETIWQRVLGLAMPAIFGWMLLAALTAYRDLSEVRFDISAADNLRARRRRTRIGILHRIGVFLLVMLTVMMMLMSIPSVRTIGVTLAASAGVAGLAIGAAAQPALKNLIAGIQMAFTEPIRIDDVVIIDNEWGRIEDIRLTYVVVRIWDDRRLVVPVSKFLENSFQNWTRETSALLGSVFWYLDPAADVPRIRDKLAEVVRASPRWDQRFFNLQVTDSKPDGTMEVRGLMTAKDASTAFDLRCEVREAIYAFIRADMPEALPRDRFMRAPADPRPAAPAPADLPSAHP
ncbi:small-conductance mechanosensitive channel [Sphingomonas insulae]|uniref:Mechanosensitive ion channel MscS domain-containing protein n=1 Tax=Sphingomonas insulae TaxID=424800 RepID=A0ABN1HNT0_9SPHN|nr:mechanosensitive ion channel domain-containing protein [Sphingomonas insulae]NIJ30794.1 small-conductance mechanosensitive channel [Sphingomonas insulae]